MAKVKLNIPELEGQSKFRRNLAPIHRWCSAFEEHPGIRLNRLSNKSKAIQKPRFLWNRLQTPSSTDCKDGFMRMRRTRELSHWVLGA